MYVYYEKVHINMNIRSCTIS